MRRAFVRVMIVLHDVLLYACTGFAMTSILDSVPNPRVKLPPMKTAELTIGRLARAANVNIETIRYYQRLNLLPTPNPKRTAFRTYPVELIDRIRFIKRAQELGFSLAEIASLLKLEDGTNRKIIRKVASERLHQIEANMTDLKRMQNALSHLIHECEAAGESQPCPIIATLAGKHRSQHRH
jgi:MerR family mercuric resistance operon transcriptional regulator